MVMLDNWQTVLRKVERWASSRDQKLGARKQLLKRLKQEFGCKTTKDAEELLEAIIDQWRKVAKVYSRMMKDLEDKYGEKLEEFDG